MVVCVGTNNRRVTFAVIILGIKTSYMYKPMRLYSEWGGGGVLLEDFLQMIFGGLIFGGGGSRGGYYQNIKQFMVCPLQGVELVINAQSK